METWRGKSALVTGANSGMGATLTKHLLEAEVTVYGLDKNTDKLFDLKNEDEHGCNLFILNADLNKEEEVLRVFKWLDENCNELNIFIHSAGIISNSNVIDGEFSEWRKLMNVNVIGRILCTKLAVNLMLKQDVKRGQVIFVNSNCALEISPYQELHYYTVTCFAERAIAEGLELELRERKSPIKVMNIYAGLVNTNLFSNAGGGQFEPLFLKSLVSLSTDDIAQLVNYVLGITSNAMVDRVQMTPRGTIKQSYFVGM